MGFTGSLLIPLHASPCRHAQHGTPHTCLLIYSSFWSGWFLLFMPHTRLPDHSSQCGTEGTFSGGVMRLFLCLNHPSHLRLMNSTPAANRSMNRQNAAIIILGANRHRNGWHRLVACWHEARHNGCGSKIAIENGNIGWRT